MPSPRPAAPESGTAGRDHRRRRARRGDAASSELGEPQLQDLSGLPGCQPGPAKGDPLTDWMAAYPEMRVDPDDGDPATSHAVHLPFAGVELWGADIAGAPLALAVLKTPTWCV